MRKATLFFSSTLTFTLIGCGIAALAVFNLPPAPGSTQKNWALVVATSVLPPLGGALLGLIVGAISARFVAGDQDR